MSENDKKQPVKGVTPKNDKTPLKRKKTTKTDTIKKEKEKEQLRTVIAKNKMVDAMQKSLGIITDSAKKAGVSRSQHYEWMNTDPEYMKRINEVAEMAKDFVESQLHDQIREGSTTATIFYMKCKMRDRGYIEKLDVDLKTNKPDLSDMTTEEIREHLSKKNE